MPTRRGVGLLIAAVLAVVLAHHWSVPVLLRVAGVLVGAVVLALVAVAFGRAGWAVRREVEPKVVEPGELITVRMRLSRERRSALDVAEWWEDASGGGHSGVVLAPGRGRLPSAHYEVRLSQRGRHQIGPTSVRVTDPFGLATRWIELRGDSNVIVLPRQVGLSPESSVLEALSERQEASDRAAASRGLGEADVVARPYRFGDAVKRLHWKATAHRGELMVREDEQRTRRRVSLVVDTRGSDDRELDWRLSAAASVLGRLHRDRSEIRVVAGEFATEVASDGSPREAMVGLALASPGATPAVLDEPGADLVVFAGRVDLDTAQEWTQPPGRRAGIAFVHAASDPTALDVLGREGWTCLQYRDRDDLAVLWERAEVRPWRHR